MWRKGRRLADAGAGTVEGSIERESRVCEGGGDSEGELVMVLGLSVCLESHERRVKMRRKKNKDWFGEEME